MTNKKVDIYGMYLVVNGNETKYIKEFTNCDIPNMSMKWWLKIMLTYILKMLIVTFLICQLNDDTKVL